MTIEPTKKQRRLPEARETTYKNFYGFSRTDGPAYELITFYDAAKKKPKTVLREWFVNGVRHREDGPSMELFRYDLQGATIAYSFEFRQNNVYHREDGPAAYLDQTFCSDACTAITPSCQHHKEGSYGWFLNGIEVGYKRVLQNAKTPEQELKVLSYILENK